MKKVYLILFFLMAANSQAQIWGYGDTTGRWIQVGALMTEGCDVSYKIAGGVPYRELNGHFFQTIGDGMETDGYFMFQGQWEVILPDTTYRPYLMWPPSLITQEYVIPGHNNMYMYDGCDDCGCDTIIHIFPDTILLVDAFGFWKHTYDTTGQTPPTDEGYVRGVSHPMKCMTEPCEEGTVGPKEYLTVHFANQYYQALPDTGNVIISGDSPLFITVYCFYALDHLTAYVCLDKFPYSPIDTIDLTRVTPNNWRGVAKSGRQLGLKSYASAIVWASYVDFHKTDNVDVCLPFVVPSRDTVFIRTDSMKIAENPSVSSYIVDDNNHNVLSTNDKIADAGYKYKSRWTANVGVKPQSYYRQFPSGLFYRQWNNTTERCQVTFNRDSLYVVGGALTYQCKGHLKPVVGIDNSFLVSTDTLASNHIDTLQTKKILIDKDPANSIFSAYFARDRIRAVAWKEWAGYGDPANCGNTQWNHYLDDKISGADTCHGRKTPCENAQSTASGIMQFKRSDWEKVFNGSDPLAPLGYYPAAWDSLAWNWKLCIDNGAYIHDTYKPIKAFLPVQHTFPDSCPYTSCGDFPGKKNQEDLKSYAYTARVSDLHLIINDQTWKDMIADTTPPISREAQYVQDVRNYIYHHPW